MALSGIAIAALFDALHLVPTVNPHARTMLTTFSFHYTFWLNVAFGALAVWLAFVNRRNPMEHCHHASVVAEGESAALSSS